MRLVDLSMPIYEGNPVGSVWPYDTPFRTEEIFTHEKHGFRSFAMTMSGEGAGTRFMLASTFEEAKDDIKVDEVELSQLILREAVIFEVPKSYEEHIELKDIKKAAGDAPYRYGDVIIIHTGWGDGGRYARTGKEYVVRGPHWTREASEAVTEMMVANGSNMMIYDGERLADLIHTGAYDNWAKKRPVPPAWPSEEAKRIAAQYVKDTCALECSSYLPFVRNRIMVIAAAVNCGEIRAQRCKVIVLPLKVKGACGAPCRVVAVLD